MGMIIAAFAISGLSVVLSAFTIRNSRRMYRNAQRRLHELDHQ